MAKKKDEAPVKTDGWKDTFSDLMNLLLCFFVLLFASSTVDAEKFQKIAQSMSESFSILKGGQTGIGEGILIASGARLAKVHHAKTVPAHDHEATANPTHSSSSPK